MLLSRKSNLISFLLALRIKIAHTLTILNCWDGLSLCGGVESGSIARRCLSCFYLVRCNLYRSCIHGLSSLAVLFRSKWILIMFQIRAVTIFSHLIWMRLLPSVWLLWIYLCHRDLSISICHINQFLAVLHLQAWAINVVCWRIVSLSALVVGLSGPLH